VRVKKARPRRATAKGAQIQRRNTADNRSARNASGRLRRSLPASGETLAKGEEAQYIYTDERGELLFKVVRRPGKRFSQHKWEGGGFGPALGDARRVPYRLPKMMAAVNSGETIYVVEGEKDVDSVERAGATATTNPGGAGKWRDEYSEYLSGANVILVWDKDRAGRKHALEVARSLGRVGATVRFRCARGSANKDVSDHLTAGFSLNQLVSKRPRAPVKRRRPTLDSSQSATPLPAMYQLVVRLLHDHAERNGRTLPRRHSDEEAWQAGCPAHDDTEPSLSIRLGDERAVVLYCHAGCSAEEVTAALGIDWHEFRGAPRVSLSASERERVNPTVRAKRSWPPSLGPAAYHGVIGEYVRAITPHTEGDPAAVLIQTVVCLGNAIGRAPHFYVEDTRHGSNLFVVVVGDTAMARKGTSLDRARRLVLAADPAWGDTNDGEGGLSTAEGLIFAVRDARNPDGDGDSGARDKRLLAAMGEFSETLEKMKRDGNPLGATMRGAWDGKTLRTRVKSDPMTATGAHVSVIGHITQAELEALFNSTHIYSGFGNRFLWVLARRARELPMGGTLRVEDLPEIVERVREAICWADERERRIDFDRKAVSEWPDLYHELGKSAGDRFGAITDRAEAQVRRLALVYAVMDKLRCVRLAHLHAAVEIWRYCEESAAYLFEDAPMGGLEVRVEKALRRRRGWTARTDLHRALKGRVTSYRLDRAVASLIESEAIKARTLNTRGRPRTEYRVVKQKETA